MFEGIVCPNDVLFVTPAPGGAPLKVNLNTECAGLLRLLIYPQLPVDIWD